MFTEMKKRSYTQRRRAERQEETRARIVDAIVALHQEVGPARTTISAIAERAGVQRLTVYRHFPKEKDLFAACTRHYGQANPLPEASAWHGIADAGERTRVALENIYRYYRKTEAMFDRVLRDLPDTPDMREEMADIETYLAEMAADLAGAWAPGRKSARFRRVAAISAHAVRFRSWQSFRQQGLKDSEIATLMENWLEVVAAG